MYCNFCGKAIPDDANLCAYCGRRVGLAAPTRKQLVRSRTYRKIAGVCAGLAEYVDMDVTLMRLLWAVVTVMSGVVPGIVAYLVAWIIMPQEPETAVVATGQQHVTTT